MTASAATGKPRKTVEVPTAAALPDQPSGRGARRLNVTPQRNAVKTQDRILSAAQAEFAGKGYDGARVEAIVSRAKVSKNLVYYYFESKEQLYIRVLERIYETLRRRQDELTLLGVEPVAAMTALCEKTFQVFVDEPDIITILNTENLHRGRHVKKSPIIRMLYERLASSLSTILDQGVEAGVFRRNLDPVDLYISMSGLGYFYLSNKYTLSLIFDRDLKTAEYVEQRKVHIVDMIMRYVLVSNIDSPADYPIRKREE
ncbi:TetR family transcriptional regulator [Mesorhizobium sp. ASY16-5R]|uniref:TetR family transcriptional regulator n=1 Tax=Mesorhizobium sp. ASY16-5R TaxID=3445772 RepID=UPI003F9FB530